MADFFPARIASPAVDVSVVMVVYRTGPDLFTSIDHVLNEHRVDDFVIVDNGSTEEDAARLRAIAEREPRIRLLHGHGNIGFARGANLGASQAAGRWLVFLNPDAFLQEGCIDALITAAASAPSPAVAGARVLNPDGTEQRGARRGEVTPVTTLLSFTHLSERGPLRRFEIHREFEPAPERAAPVPTISGACFCVSRRDFERLNGFDGRFFLHVEDIDLCWRARQMGGQVLFQPNARVIHVGHTSHVEPMLVEWHKGRGLARYFRKRADNPLRMLLAWALGPLIVLAAVSRPVLRSLTGGPVRRLRPADETAPPATGPKG
ncbi:glycosyltransferase family 2 protein [Brevundimonas sp. 2R-24]|uniref:Glycosyltransferase family 2 protein n=2 Tax=Peiella sedimenti TaxID=3061083 RepID=A0ABT8SH04_9CAUL|nr:glycosyltransferase family 2 protein [Caulobacteraceae bacterium XZ-24]